MIGEYMGRLMPLGAVRRPVRSAYIYTIGGWAECDAERYCNVCTPPIPQDFTTRDFVPRDLRVLSVSLARTDEKLRTNHHKLDHPFHQS